jgi:hypothetical protein
LENRRAKQILLGGKEGLVAVGGGGRKRCRRVKMAKYCVHIHVNAKMIPAEAIPEMGEER